MRLGRWLLVLGLNLVISALAQAEPAVGIVSAAVPIVAVPVAAIPVTAPSSAAAPTPNQGPAAKSATPAGEAREDATFAFVGAPPELATGERASANQAAAEPSSTPLGSIPLGKGLPVTVRAGVYFVDVSEIDDNEGAFVATVDVRLRWQDLRLNYEPTLAPSGFKEFRGAEADAKLTEIWSPDIHLDNLLGEATFERRGVRIFPDGNVELMIRTAGKFESAFNVESFPFDRQQLTVQVASQRDTQDKVLLDFRQNELDFSKLAPKAGVDGWTLGLVDIRRATQPGWYGQSYAKVEVSLGAERLPGGSAAAIFIPLLASLLIPLLAMWLNTVVDAEFQVEAFELTNIIIGGLFAVIALNFTVNAEYQMLSGDNTVSRLFVLNYVTLGISLLINLLLFRFNVVARCFGKYAQEQLYVYFVWAVPSLVAITAGAVLLSALV